MFAALIKTPEDRVENAKGLFEAAGCTLIDYYFGINNYKVYIILECPNDEALAAIQFATFAAGGIAEGTATQIVTSAEMVDVARQAAKLAGSYRVPE